MATNQFQGEQHHHNRRKRIVISIDKSTKKCSLPQAISSVDPGIGMNVVPGLPYGTISIKSTNGQPNPNNSGSTTNANTFHYSQSQSINQTHLNANLNPHSHYISFPNPTPSSILNIDGNPNSSYNTLNYPNNESSQSTSISLFNPSKQLPKLFQISQRCLHYYDKFKEDRLEQQQYMDVMFLQIVNQLDAAFKEIHALIDIKHNQIKDAIITKKKQFMEFHPRHFLSLTQKIQIIRQHKIALEKTMNCASSINSNMANSNINLSSNSNSNLNINKTNSIFTNYNSQSQFQGLSCNQNWPKDTQLSQMAKLLNQFYCQIQAIQRVNFKQNIKQSVNFLKNLIQDQCSSLLNKNVHQFQYTQQQMDVNQTPNGNISFNNQQLFSVKQFNQQSSQFLWQQFRAATERVQKDRQQKIQSYLYKISTPVMSMSMSIPLPALPAPMPMLQSYRQQTDRTGHPFAHMGMSVGPSMMGSGAGTDRLSMGHVHTERANMNKMGRMSLGANV